MQRRREGDYLEAPPLPSHFLLLFLPFRFKCFFLASFFFSNKRKKRKTQRKKNHRRKKKWKEGRELTFFLSLLHLE
jgi:hypothetical protein